MGQEKYDNYCEELTVDMYGCVDCSLLYIFRFCKYAVSTKGLGLTQSKVYPWIFIRKPDKGKPKIIVIYYVENCCIMVKPEHVEEKKKKTHKEFGIVRYGKIKETIRSTIQVGSILVGRILCGGVNKWQVKINY